MKDFTDLPDTVFPVAGRAPKSVQNAVYGIGARAVTAANRLERRLRNLATDAASAADAVRAGGQLPIGLISQLGVLIEAAAEYGAHQRDWTTVVATFPATAPAVRETTPERPPLVISSTRPEPRT